MSAISSLLFSFLGITPRGTYIQGKINQLSMGTSFLHCNLPLVTSVSLLRSVHGEYFEQQIVADWRSVGVYPQSLWQQEQCSLP